jgi:hypothetical protein
MNLPTFIVIGAAKSGTSSLYNYLGQHPSIHISPVPKTNFFATNFIDGKPVLEDFDLKPEQVKKFDFYVTNFEAYQKLFDNVEPNKTALGEISPMYLNSFVAAQKIKAHNPNVKLIAILRNPIERAYSGYQMQLRQANEHRNFTDNIDPSEIYIRGGFYYNQLRRFYELFDHNQIKVILFDDFKQTPLKIMQEIFRFIDVDDTFCPDLSTKFNQGGIPKNQKTYNFLFNSRFSIITRKIVKFFIPLSLRFKIASIINKILLSKPKSMPNTVKQLLKNTYRDDILKLEQLIKVDLQRWLN